MKKLITVLLACLLICAVAVPGLAEEVPTMSLSVSKSTVNPGDTITVTVNISETADCTSAGLVISYDTAAFEMVENSFVATVENLQASCKYNSRAQSYVVSIQFESAQALSGKLFTFQLKVKDAAPLNANYTISGTPSVRVNKVAVSSEVQGASVRVACVHKYDNACDAECNACGATREISHSYNSAVTKNPDCKEEGIRTYTCSVCGDSYTKPIDRTNDHKYDNACDAECNVCGATRTITHSYNSAVTKNPDCKEEGVRTYTCSVCGHSYTEPIDKTEDHKYGDWVKVDDSTHKHTCSICGKEEPASHSYTSSVTKNPDCKDEGERTYTCSCGHSYTEPIDKTEDHQYAAGEKIDDSTHKTICSICGKEGSASHSYTSSVTKKPDCKTEGEETFTCACGHSYTKPIDKTDKHSYESEVTKKATCKEAGVRTYTCSVCDHSYTKAIKKLDHKYDHGCDTDCNACGETRKTEHVYSEYWSYDEKGHWHECKNCHHIPEVLAHTPGPEATEVTDQVCLDCGYVLKKAEKHTHTAVGDWLKDENGHWHLCGCGEAMDQQAHTWDQGTLNDDGSVMNYSCTVCGQTKTEDVQKPTDPTEPSQPSQTEPQDPNQPGQNDNDDGFPWIIVAVAVIALAGILILIILGIRKKKQEDQ